ncbi:SDR family oxidoreductase [Xenophilus arseniciresistens]|uniref:SDR family oxidoreductase n=1 Tax=Xenophilus arseniciresistens TaxID=1283306 RepID=A0AAE3NBA9_9BURK|nr:SDR family oxidoreductase [Xenophilus arseniciresistens]MDA7419200.1 SDR family oxidoreductase [Xenophilus arseniciresistens]
MDDRVALIAGASGVVGRGMAQRLVEKGWRVLCVSRSGGGGLPGTEGLAVDLMDPAACARALAPHTGITHVFYAAFQQAPSRAAEVAPNLAMLRNVVEAAQQASPVLRKVVLVTGAKFYGIQWGASPTPCRESDPRQLPPNFYYDQEDWLRAASRERGWRWVNLIPPFVSGYAVGNPMNLVLGIGLYAAVCRELGLPLRFPGSMGAYEAMHQIADAWQIGGAAAWAADSPAADDGAFNVSNGDPARWCQTWPVLADALGMACAAPKTLPLADMMPAQQAVWERIAQRHGLQPLDIARVVDWRWMDYMLRQSHDIVLSTFKIRRAGFHDCIETDATLVQRLRELQANKVLPP